MVKTKDDILTNLVQWFEDAEEATQDARRIAELHRDYYDNKQLTQEQKSELARRGQPEVILNLIQDKVDFLLGFETTIRTDPKALPRNPNHDDNAAEATSDALNYQKDKMNLNQHFSQVLENMIIEGFGGGELEIERTQKGIEINNLDVFWDRAFYDPHSRKHDFSDAKYKGLIVWMDADDAKARWPGKADIIDTTMDGEIDDTYDDRPAWKSWISRGKRKRVRIVQIYWQENSQWYWAIYTKGGVLEGNVKIPHVDEDGKSFCPLTLQSAYVDRENDRYGLVKILISPQDEVNKRRSKLLHLLNSNQTIGEEGAVDDVDQMKAEKAKPDGHIEINRGFELNFRDHSQQIQGQSLLLQDTKEHFDNIGPNAAQLGTQGSSASGRAIALNQTSGQIRIAKLFDRHKHYKNTVYRKIWNMIRQYKTEKWWVRVTDNENNVKFVGFNRPVTAQEEFVEQLRKHGIPDQEIEQQLQAIAQTYGEDVLQQVVRTENVPADMDMDIILDETPDMANIQQEQFNELSKLLGTGLQLGDPRLKLLIMASSLRNKKQLLDELEGDQNPEQAAAIQANNELELDEKRAKIEEIRSKTLKNLAQADDIDFRQSIQPINDNQDFIIQ